MPKQAFLIDVSIMHRVVVDVPKKFSELKLLEQVWDQLMTKVRATVNSEGVEYDNVTSIKPDLECPYGTFNDEK